MSLIKKGEIQGWLYRCSIGDMARITWLGIKKTLTEYWIIFVNLVMT